VVYYNHAELSNELNLIEKEIEKLTKEKEEIYSVVVVDEHLKDQIENLINNNNESSTDIVRESIKGNIPTKDIT
jgi:vacuolar-type H+-ATPase subunit F/Vma7